MAKIFFYQDREIFLNKDDWKHLEEGKGVEIFYELRFIEKSQDIFRVRIILKKEKDG